MPHSFVSYLHEDSPTVERLVDELRRAGVETWFDRESLRAGGRWAEAIETAIESGGFFIACFSRAYARREQTYMHEELAVARRALRARARERAWLIPVLIDGCSPQEVGLTADPDWGPLHAVALQPDWLAGIRSVLQVVSPQRAFGRCLNGRSAPKRAGKRTRAPMLALDFGTSNSLLAYRSSAGRWTPIRGADGRALHPSVVTFDESWNYWVGHEAQEAAMRRPNRSVNNIKRLLLSGQEVELEHKRFSAVTLAGLVIRHLADCAQAQLGTPVTRVMVSVPTDFGWFHKEALVRACALARLTVEGLVPEPNATGSAAVAWIRERPDLSAAAQGEYGGAIVLIVDVGGGTTDVSLEIISNNASGRWTLETVATAGDNALGGMDYDAAVYRWLHAVLVKPQLKKKSLRWNADDDQRLALQARHLKEALAIADRATVTVPEVETRQGTFETLTLAIGRDDVAPALRSLDKRLLALVDVALEAGTQRWGREHRSPIRGVLLGGQGSKLWTIAAALRQRFAEVEIVTQFQDNAVSLGLAWHAWHADAARRGEQFLMLSVMTRGIGVRACGARIGAWASDFAGVAPHRFRAPLERGVKLLLSVNAMSPTWIGHEFDVGPGPLVLEFVEIDRAGRTGDVLGVLRAAVSVAATLEVRVIVNRGDNRVFELRDPRRERTLDRLELTFARWSLPSLGSEPDGKELLPAEHQSC